MKSKFSRILISGLLLMGVQCLWSAPVYAEGSYKVIDSKYGIDRNKMWVVRFTKEIDAASVNNNTVKIFDEASVQLNNISVQLDPNNPKTIIIRPNVNYGIDKRYNIIIQGIRTRTGQILNKPVTMQFVTKSLFHGLPSDKGLVIVDDGTSGGFSNSAKAYTIDYLSANGNIMNEILASNKYAVYCNNDENGTKVKSIFGNGNRLSDAKPAKITYIDLVPGKISYMLNSKGEYDKINPTAFLDITVNKDVDKVGKVVNLNVKAVNGIYDVSTYKFSVEQSNSIKSLGQSLIFYTENDSQRVSILSGDGDEIGTINVNLGYTATGKIADIDFNPKTQLGNTAGNINNAGLSAKDKSGFIYYNNGSEKNKLYKFNENGVSNVQISGDDAKYINATGDYIYYSNYSDDGKLYKMKNDGTGKVKICDDTVAYVVVAGKDIYYSNHSDGGKIYTIKNDGSNATTKSEDKTKHGICVVGSDGDSAFLNMVGDNIYYINYSDNNKPYIVNRYGIYKGKVSDESISSMIVRGDSIYYANSEGSMKKMNRDASGQPEILAGGDKVTTFNLSSDYLYYSNFSDGNKLYKMNLLTGQKQKMTNEAVEYINIMGNTPFYSNKSILYKATGNLDPKIKPMVLPNTSTPRKINKVNDISKIVSYKDADKSMEDIEKLYLPEKVTAFMDDSSLVELLVTWDKTKVSMKDGVRTYNGTMLGFTNKIKLNLTIPSKELTTSQIKIYNSSKNGTVKVDNLSTGDIIKIYDNEYLEKSFAQSSAVTRDGIAVMSKIKLPTDGKRLYFTITKLGRKESNATYIDPVDAPAITSCKDEDGAYLGVDGRDITVKWTRATKNYPYRQKLYVLPKGTALDMETQKEVYLDSGNYSEDWTGDMDTKDSLEKKIVVGSYDVYVVAENGNSFTASDAASVTLVPEDVLKQPVIPAHVFIIGGSDYILPFVVDRGITAWIVPLNVKIDKTTQISEGMFPAGAYSKFIGNGLDTIIKAPTKEGEYKIVLSNSAGNSALSSGIMHVDNTPPDKPVLTKVKSGYAQYIKVSNGDAISALSYDDGKIYLIKRNYFDWALDILQHSIIKNDEAALKVTLGGRAIGATCKRGVPVTFKVEAIENGDYYAVAVDLAGNVSVPSGTIDSTGNVTGQVINVDTIGPDILEVTPITVGDGGVESTEVTLSEDGEVFLIYYADYIKTPDKFSKRSDLTPLINSRKAKYVSTTKTGDLNKAKIDTRGLVYGDYVLAACDKAGNLRIGSTVDMLRAVETPSIIVSATEFYRDPAQQKHITVKVDARGNELSKVLDVTDETKPPIELQKGSHYSMDENTNTLSIFKDYLRDKPGNKLKIKFVFTNKTVETKVMYSYISIRDMQINPKFIKELTTKTSFVFSIDKLMIDNECIEKDNVTLKLGGVLVDPIKYDLKVLDTGLTYQVTLLGGETIEPGKSCVIGFSKPRYFFGTNSSLKIDTTPIQLETPKLIFNVNGEVSWTNVKGAKDYTVELFNINSPTAVQTVTMDHDILSYKFDLAAKGLGSYYVVIKVNKFPDALSNPPGPVRSAIVEYK